MTDLELVLEILEGKWGSGDTRKKKLTEAGYDYDKVQALVTKKMEKMRTRKEAMKPWFDACKEQEQWSYNAKYNWGKWSPKNIAKSKDYGTCITFPNVVAMRCGLIKESYKIITSTGSDNDSKATQNSFYNNSVKAMNSINGKYWSSIKYPEKTTAQLVKEGKIKEGDIIGFMGHTASYAYKDSKGNLLFNHAGHAAGIYDNNKPGSNRAVLNVKSSYMTNRKVYGVFSVNTFIVLTSCKNGNITYSNRYMAGQKVTITIKPNAGMGVQSIKVDGKAVGVTTSYVIDKIDSHHIIEVVCGVVKKKTIDEIAKEVIAGKWGNGDIRKKRLTDAGYDYDLVQARVNEILSPKKKTYSGTLPSLTLKKINAQVINDAILWAIWIAGDNTFHYGYTNKSKTINAHHNGCYFCGTNTDKGGRSKKGIVDYQHTYCCNPFVNAAWAHGGCVPKALSLCQKGSSWGFSKGSGYDASTLFTKLGHPAKSKLKKGDVLCRDTHVALYIGDGKIVEAGNGDDNKKGSTKWNNSISVKALTDANYKNFPRVYRFNSSVNTSMALRHGEVSDRVKLWQEFLNWYYDGKLGKTDRYFGDITLKWTKQFQKDNNLDVDGIVGTNTLAMASKVKK